MSFRLYTILNLLKQLNLCLMWVKGKPQSKIWIESKFYHVKWEKKNANPFVKVKRKHYQSVALDQYIHTNMRVSTKNIIIIIIIIILLVYLLEMER